MLCIADGVNGRTSLLPPRVIWPTRAPQFKQAAEAVRIPCAVPGHRCHHTENLQLEYVPGPVLLFRPSGGPSLQKGTVQTSLVVKQRISSALQLR